MEEPPLANVLQYRRPDVAPRFNYRKTVGSFAVGAVLPPIAVLMSLMILSVLYRFRHWDEDLRWITAAMTFLGTAAIVGCLGVVATIAIRMKIVPVRPQGRVRVMGIVLGTVNTIAAIIGAPILMVLSVLAIGMRTPFFPVIACATCAALIAIPMGIILSPREQILS